MAALKAGMPVRPLAIQDEVSLTLSEHVANERYKALEAQDQTITKSPADDVIHSMIHEFNRKGKAVGAGFYDYPADAKEQLWSGLSHWKRDDDISEQEMIDRFLFVQASGYRALFWKKVSWNLSVDANVGSIFGIGFAAWTGGAVQFLNQYGLAKARDSVPKYLKMKYGERFKAPQLLKDRAAHAQPIQ